MRKVKAFLKGLFWEKRDLVLQIEALQTKIRRNQRDELTPEEREIREKQKVSAEEHKRLLLGEIDAVRRMLGRNEPVFISNLLGRISVMPDMLEKAIIARKLGSSRHGDEFTGQMRTYFVKLCSEITDLCVRFEQDNPSACIAARMEAAEFLNGYGCYPGMAGTTYHVDALFDGQHHALEVDLPHGEKDIVTTFRTAVLFFRRALESMNLSGTVSPAGISR